MVLGAAFMTTGSMFYIASSPVPVVPNARLSAAHCRHGRPCRRFRRRAAESLASIAEERLQSIEVNVDCIPVKDEYQQTTNERQSDEHAYGLRRPRYTLITGEFCDRCAKCSKH